MEKDLEELKLKAQQFCEKYKCTISAETTIYGQTYDGNRKYQITVKVIK